MATAAAIAVPLLRNGDRLLGNPPKPFIQNGYLAIDLPLEFSSNSVAVRRLPH